MVATGSGFEPGAELVVTWEDTTAMWNVDLVEGKFYGRKFTQANVPLRTVVADADAAFEFDFEVPETSDSPTTSR